MQKNRTYSLELGQRLKETFKAFGSKRAAAEAAGCTVETFSSWISGGPKVPIQALKAYSDSGNIDFVWLCTGIKVEKNRPLDGVLPNELSQLITDAFVELESLLIRESWAIPDSRYKIKLAIALAEEAYQQKENNINLNQHIKVIQAIAS